MTLLLALFAVALPGYALARQASCSRGLRAALAAAFGAGLWSASYAVLLFAGGATHEAAKDVGLCVAGALALLLPARPVMRPGEPAPRWLRVAFACAAVLCLAFVVEHVLRFPDGGWDAKMIWNLRARWLERGGAGFRTAFSPHLLFWAHQDYPLLLPGVVAQVFLAAKSEALVLPGLVGLFFAALALALVTLGVRELRGDTAGFLAGLALATTPCFVPLAANQQADVPMGAFFALATLLVALSLERDARLLSLAGFAASLGVWTKNEGTLYFAAFVAALALWQGPRALARFVAGALPVLLLLVWFRISVPTRGDLSGFSTPADFRARLLDASRWGTLAIEWLRRLVFFQDVGVWVVAELALLAVLRPRPRVIGTVLLLSMAGWAAVYVLQPHPLAWFFRASISRLFIQAWPSIVIATALAGWRVPARATAGT